MPSAVGDAAEETEASSQPLGRLINLSIEHESSNYPCDMSSL